MSIRPLAPTPTAVASVRAALATHAAVARNLNAQYEATSTGVTADGKLEGEDLRLLLVSLAGPELLRNIFSRLTRSEIRELQSKLDDVQADQFEGGMALASQNFLLERFQEAEARAEPPPVLMPPVVMTQFASAADSYETTPEILERQRTIYQNTARLRSIEIPEGLPPPPPTPPSASGVDFFSFADLGYRMCVLDRATDLRINDERPRVADFLLAADLFNVQDRIHHFFQDVYLVQDAAGKEQLRHEARIAEPLQAFDAFSAGDQLRYFYDFEWALKSRYYQYLSELLQLHHNNPPGEQRAAAYARYKQRQEARAAALLHTDVDVGSSLGRLLVLQATTLMDRYFDDPVD